VEEAPAALRDAGLRGALQEAGWDVHDQGDLTRRLWTPDRVSRYAQNVSEEAEATAELADVAARILSADERLLVLGGSCVVAVGLCAAMARVNQRPRIVYIDRHLDLNTPLSTTEGSLSWMGMAHALNVDGVASELAEATGQAPILHSTDLVYLGVELTQTTDGERSHVDALALKVVEQSALCDHPQQAARTARKHLEPGPFVVHVDVDVLDFINAPLAENVNGRNSGPTIDQLGLALSELLAEPDCWAVSIGQLVPAHASADATAIPRLIAALAAPPPASAKLQP
jgi:arginase